MIENWEYIIGLIANEISRFTKALAYIFEFAFGFDIETFEINFFIFSETPIFTISLYHLINLVIFFFLFKWLFNLVMSLILAPINYVKRLLSPRGVTKR